MPVNETTAVLRDLDGHLLRLSEELRNPAAPDEAKKQIDSDIRRLMTRRTALLRQET